MVTKKQSTFVFLTLLLIATSNAKTLNKKATLESQTQTKGDIPALSTMPVDTDPQAVYKHLYKAPTGDYYINLANTGDNDNFSTYKMPSNKPWNANDSDVKTVWYKLRFDPNTLLAHTGDFTYTISNGMQHHSSNNQANIPFATAFDCAGGQSRTGTAKIDLRGTNLAVDDTFTFNGHMPGGTVTASYNNQVIELTGGGYCGWIAPQKAAGDEWMTHQGGFHLKLKVIATCEYMIGNDCYIAYNSPTSAFQVGQKFLIRNEVMYNGSAGSIPYRAILQPYIDGQGGHDLAPRGYTYQSSVLSSNANTADASNVLKVTEIGSDYTSWAWESTNHDVHWDSIGYCWSGKEHRAVVEWAVNNAFTIKPYGCGGIGGKLYMDVSWPAIKAERTTAKSAQTYMFSFFLKAN